MRLPLIASTSAFRAWSGGVALAIAVVCLPFATVLLPLPMPFASAFYLIPLGCAALVLYSLTVRPRAFAVSGALLGVAPFFAWGVIDGLQKCARSTAVVRMVAVKPTRARSSSRRRSCMPPR